MLDLNYCQLLQKCLIQNYLEDFLLMLLKLKLKQKNKMLLINYFRNFNSNGIRKLIIHRYNFLR